MVQWHEFGETSGIPVIYLHGTPGSGAEAQVLGAAAKRLGIRLIAPDRPGMGRSRFHSGHDLSTWPGTFRELLTEAGVARAGILAWSGGGPFALACVAEAPELVHGLALLAPAELLPGAAEPAAYSDGGGSGSGRFQRCLDALRRLGAAVAMRGSHLLALIPGTPGLAATLVFRARRLAPLGAAARSWISPADAAGLLRGWRVSFARGARGPERDNELITSDWGEIVSAAQSAIDANSVASQIWHGTRDHVVPVTASRDLAPALGIPLVEIPGCSHRGVILRHGGAALRFLRGAGHVA